MLQTEFIRSLQSNYERILLQQKPDERRYQYCILTRGGIKGLLPCSLRYINGQVYLYYDITSRQNVAQLTGKQKIGREWVRDFLWSYSQTRQELGRFLLDEKNILVFPEQIFQDLGNRNFFFLYLPYNEEDNGFAQLFDFLVEHLDYEDDLLVECVYKMYEQYDQAGEMYLQEKIFEDAACLDSNAGPAGMKEGTDTMSDFGNGEKAPDAQEDVLNLRESLTRNPEPENAGSVKANVQKPEKKRILRLLGGKKKKNLEMRKNYYESMMELEEERAVAEDTVYDAQEYGKTVYMEVQTEEKNHRLYTPDGRVAAQLETEILMIGKQREEVDLVLEDESVSRMHARIFTENGVWYLEDLNSTNGTFKNGLQLQPYEKRRLEEGDEIKIGKILFVYR